MSYHNRHHNRFKAPFSGTTQSAGARKLLDFMVQGWALWRRCSCCVLLTYAAACYLLTVAATDCACAVRWFGASCLLSDGVTIDDVSVCVVRKSKMFIVSRVVPFDYGNNLSSTVM